MGEEAMTVLPRMPNHPQCLCHWQTVMIEDQDEVITSLRKQYGLTSSAPLTVSRPALPSSAYPLGQKLPHLDETISTDHASRARAIRSVRPVENVTSFGRELDDEWRPFYHTLDPDDVNQILDYTGVSYRRTNRWARGLGEPEEGKRKVRTQATLEAMERVMASPGAATQRDLKLYRGMESMPDRVLNLKPGDTVTDWGFGSHSLDPSTARSFTSSGTNSMTFEVLAPKGTRGVWVSDEAGGGLASEYEFILPRGYTYVVRDTVMEEVSEGVRHLHVIAEVIPEVP